MTQRDQQDIYFKVPRCDLEIKVTGTGMESVLQGDPHFKKMSTYFVDFNENSLKQSYLSKFVWASVLSDISRNTFELPVGTTLIQLEWNLASSCSLNPAYKLIGSPGSPAVQSSLPRRPKL